jgi:hypothetical protein
MAKQNWKNLLPNSRLKKYPLNSKKPLKRPKQPMLLNLSLILQLQQTKRLAKHQLKDLGTNLLPKVDHGLAQCAMSTIRQKLPNVYPAKHSNQGQKLKHQPQLLSLK